MRIASRFRTAACLAASVASTACLTNAFVTNLGDDSCRSTLVQAVAAILIGQHEPPDVAGQLAYDAVQRIAPNDPSQVRFAVSSPSGTDYGFVFRVKSGGCSLRLESRSRGRWTYENDLTYIATEPLTGCTCMALLRLRDSGHVGVHPR